MYIPAPVLELIHTLEAAGQECWVVGGCVRDHCLGIPPHDYDCCTAATPDEMQAIFEGRQLVLAGLKHGTVGVVTDAGVVEVTTFRTEGDYADARHPGWVRFVRNLEADLARRDFTINAMAYSPKRGFADPFGGREDLKNRVLRAVGDPELRFQEDALRILRGLRFAARFGLTMDAATRLAMHTQLPGLDVLAMERIFVELEGFLCHAKAADLVAGQEILCRILPELSDCVGFRQQNPHHIHDVFVHTAQVVAAVPPTAVLRFAALLHDIGKPGTFSLDEGGIGHFYGHASRSAELADAILLRLKAPTALREEIVFLVRHHMTVLPPEEKAARRWLSRHGLTRMEHLLALQTADGMAQGAEFLDLLHALAEKEGELSLKTLAIQGRDLLALGMAPGPEVGKLLQTLLQQVLDGELPNKKDALLEASNRALRRA